QMSAAVNPLSVGSNAISLSAAGVPVPGSITVSSDASTLTFTPSGLLSPSTAYSVSASDFADQAGNQVMPFTGGFTTGTSGVANILSPAVISVTPASGNIGVSVNTTIVLTFHEALNPL